MANQKSSNFIIKQWEKFLPGDVLFIPIIGPVYTSGKPLKKLLIDLINNADKDNFLSYDKNIRWFKEKQEKILLNHISATNTEVCVPVIKNNLLNIYHYSHKPAGENDIKRIESSMGQLINKDSTEKAFIHFNQRPYCDKNMVCSEIFFKKISTQDIIKEPLENIDLYNKINHSVRESFSRLGDEPEMEGFRALWEHFIVKNLIDSSIICATQHDSIVGAIGPIDIMTDCWGIKFLAPPYFGVLNSMRQQGIGQKLWKSAMSLATGLDAKYTLVQNKLDSPAAKFYLSQGLTASSGNYCLQIK